MSVRIPVTFDAAEKHPISWVSSFGEWSLISNKREKTNVILCWRGTKRDIHCTKLMAAMPFASWSHYYHSHEANSCFLFLLFLYSGCINHVLYTLFEFNARNDVNLVWSLTELLVSTQTFSLTSVDYSIRTLSFISKSDKSTWLVRSCLIHTTCQKINNNFEFGR